MAKTLNVYALPTLIEPERMAGGTAVVIDVLRASTTIVYALQAGAREVIPCQEVDEARGLAAEFPDGEALLGGERGGRPIEGFDLGNSPAEYLPEKIAGRTIVFTTSNGTRAMHRARFAERTLIASFVNVSAVVERLIDCEHIHLLCAGTNGQISQDDVLLAGLLAERLQRNAGLSYEENAQAITARETWLHSFALPTALGGEPLPPHRLAKELRKSPGGRNLVAIGQDRDILIAAEIDRFDVVPELDHASNRIRLM